MTMIRMMTTVPTPMYMRTSLRQGPGTPFAQTKTSPSVVVSSCAYLFAAEVKVD
jgi:hypothetical protein